MNTKGNMSTGWIIFLVVVIALGGYFLMTGQNVEAPDTNGDTSTTTDEVVDDSATTTDSESQNTVTYINQRFSPASLTISTGETVTFVNSSDSEMWVASAIHPTHEVYSGTSLEEHCNGTDNEAFDACEGTPSGESWSFTFDKAGTWNYHDHLNASNTGAILVE